MMKNTISESNSKMRESGIELLKILAIFIIVISHVVKTLTVKYPEVPNYDYMIDVSRATNDIRNIICLIFRYFGVWGNSIFFICSSWFLLKSKGFKKRKWLFMLAEIWVISVIILIITYLILNGGISNKIILKSFFPTLFMNNWYMTCYLLFYPIHPILNKVIYSMNKVQLFRSSMGLAIVYIILNFIDGEWFFASNIILWIAIYFVMAYLQRYLSCFMNDIKRNIAVFLFGSFGFLGSILITEFIGLHISALSDKMLHWDSNSNPFLLAMAITMFNIFRNMKFKNKFINYISSLSLLIYIIHENLILKIYFRTALWNFMYNEFGYSHVVFWILVLSLSIFIFGILAAIVYTLVLKKTVIKISNNIYDILRKKYIKLENRLLNYE